MRKWRIVFAIETVGLGSQRFLLSVLSLSALELTL